VYQRADGYWVGAVSGIDGTGRRRRVVVYGKTKGDALTKLKEVRPIGPDVVNDVRGLTVAGWLDRWLEMARAGLAPTTALRYGELIRLRLKPLIGGVKLAQVGVFHVQKLLADMEGREISARGRQMAFLVLSRALKAAVKARLLQYNPAADVEGKPRVPKPEVTVYTEEESALLLAAAQGHRLAPLLVVAMDSGARQGELFALTWANIDFPAGAMTIRRTLEDGTLRLKEPKTGKGRRVHLSAYTMQILSQHRKAMLVEGHCRHDAPVFCDCNGGWLRKSNFIR